MESNMKMGLKDIPDLYLISDDEEMDEETFSASDLLQASEQDDVSNSLLNSGTLTGVAAAAALVGSRKRQQRPYKFEVNPSHRKRHHTRLIRKLKHTIHELCTRCGQQAVVVCVSPGKSNPTCRVFGSSPLDQVVKDCQSTVICGLEKELQANVQSNLHSNGLFDLPPLNIDGIPTSVDEMNQSQLRMFIPEMLKYSLGRGKPGWGKESKKPVWWPQDLPWANVRRDDRTQEAKLHVSWTQALRQIVKNCYRYHGREDLLRCIVSDYNNKPVVSEIREKATRTSATVVTPPTLVQTIHNADGSVSLVQIDSGQTLATISRDQTGTTVATFSSSVPDDDGHVDIDDMASTNWTITNQENGIDDTFAGMTGVNTDSSEAKPSNGFPLSFNGTEQVVAQASMSPLNSTLETSAMVQIPMSVYEKLAHTINQTGSSPTVSISADGRIQLQAEILDMSAHEQRKAEAECDAYKQDRGGNAHSHNEHA